MLPARHACCRFGPPSWRVPFPPHPITRRSPGRCVCTQMVAADKRRQSTREALSALRSQRRRAEQPAAAHLPPQQQSQPPPPPAKVWVAALSPAGTGPCCFAKQPAEAAVEQLQQEQQRLDAQLEALRREQKRLTALLADKGGVPDGTVGHGMLGAMLNLAG